MSIMGTRVVRVEDPQFLTRGAVYTDDLTDERLTGALHLTFVRSPLAHARITGVDDLHRTLTDEAAGKTFTATVLREGRMERLDLVPELSR